MQSRKPFLSYVVLLFFSSIFLAGSYCLFNKPIRMAGFSVENGKSFGLEEYPGRLRAIVLDRSSGQSTYRLVAITNADGGTKVENAFLPFRGGESGDAIVDVEGVGDVLVSVVPLPTTSGLTDDVNVPSFRISIVYPSSDENDSSSGMESMDGVERSVYVLKGNFVSPISYMFRVKHEQRVMTIKFVSGLIPAVIGLIGTIVVAMRMRAAYRVARLSGGGVASGCPAESGSAAPSNAASSTRNVYDGFV